MILVSGPNVVADLVHVIVDLGRLTSVQRGNSRFLLVSFIIFSGVISKIHSIMNKRYIVFDLHFLEINIIKIDIVVVFVKFSPARVTLTVSFVVHASLKYQN